MVAHGTIHKLCIVQQKQKYTCQLAEQLAIHRINLVDKIVRKKKLEVKQQVWQKAVGWM